MIGHAIGGTSLSVRKGNWIVYLFGTGMIETKTSSSMYNTDLCIEKICKGSHSFLNWTHI